MTFFSAPLTETEIKNILTLLPNNKAPGDDGITYEHVLISFDDVLIKKARSTLQQNS